MGARAKAISFSGPRLAGVFAAVALSLLFAASAGAAFPGANGRIAFVEGRLGFASEVMTVRADGSGLVDLTNHPAQDLHPAWSPDGRRIAFTRADFFGHSDVYVMNADGTGVAALTDDHQSSMPTWSPDGTKIAYVAPSDVAAQDDVWVMSADGSGEPTRITETPGFEADPTWSPDGTEIVFTGSPWRIYKSPADGSDLTPTPLTAGDTEGYPDWSPDGTEIAYSAPVGEGVWQVHRMKPDGSEQTLVPTASEASNPAWSPDGTKLLVVVDGFRLATIEPDGGEPLELGQTGSQPSWQPWLEGHYPPVASFTSPSGPVQSGTEVKFTSTSTGGDGEVDSLAWDLDNDGAFDDASGPTATTTFSDAETYTVRLSVVNDEGHRDAIAAQVEVVAPPETAIDQGPASVRDSTPSFAFSSPTTGTSFECRLDGGAFGGCASPYTTPPLPDGSHVFEVRAKDVNGFVDPSPATQSFAIDTLPETAILAGPPPLASSRAATFDFAADQPASFECRLDGGNWTACTSRWSYSGLADGSHSFTVKATDSTGNVDPTPVVFFWTIDATPPPLRVKAKLRQNPLPGRALQVKVGCGGEPCSSTATGSVAIGAKSFALKRARSQVAAGGSVVLRLRLAGKTLSEVRDALAERRRVTAAVTVRAGDAIGNVAESETTIRLVAPPRRPGRVN